MFNTCFRNLIFFKFNALIVPISFFIRNCNNRTDKMIFGTWFDRTILSNPVKYESFPYKEKLPDEIISVFCIHFKIKTKTNKKIYGHLSYLRSSKISNPLLNNFEFIKKYISPEDAWQKIYDFISSRNEKPIIDNRSDVEHLESAGFDKKTSFRNIK